MSEPQDHLRPSDDESRSSGLPENTGQQATAAGGSSSPGTDTARHTLVWDWATQDWAVVDPPAPARNGPPASYETVERSSDDHNGDHHNGDHHNVNAAGAARPETTREPQQAATDIDPGKPPAQPETDREDTSAVTAPSSRGPDTDEITPPSPPVDSTAQFAGGSEPPESPPRSKWKTIGFAVAAALLLFALVRAMLGGSDQGALDTTGGQPGAKKPLPPPKENKPPTALVEGARIPVSGPVITLNPGLVRQGAKVGINGVGFDTRAFVDVEFTVAGAKQSQPVAGAPVGRNGSFNAEFTVPPMPGADKAVVTARQRGSGKVATADAVVPGGVAFAALSKETGRPGEQLNVSGSGFQPGEKVNVHWGRIDGPPSEQLSTDKNGSLNNAPLKVGVTPVGNGTLLLIGDRSKTTATAPFIMQGLYPTVTVQPYAMKAGQRLEVSGEGFAPREPVLLYINSSGGEPAMRIPAGDSGNVDAAFAVPYELKGGQTLTMVGEQSRASSTSGFEIMPYTPTAQPSTYGGMPGTSLTFYATGFAPNEVVMVYKGRSSTSEGDLVSAFRVDDQGKASAAGSYQIPANANGQLNLDLVGRQSKASTTASMSVQGATGTVKIPEPPKYVLPPELQGDPVVPGGPPPPVPSAKPAPPAPAPGGPGNPPR